MPYKKKEDQVKAAKAHYEKNKVVIKERSLKHKKYARLRNKNFVQDYLKDKSCIDCGNDDIRVLEFDHVRGEKYNSISRMVNNACSIDRIIKEIKKCEIRCANCHRIKTHETVWNKKS